MAGEGISTPYFVHCVEVKNDPHLTQVLYYIVMLGNVELFRRLVEEFNLGSDIIGSDYDAVITRDFPRAPIVDGKVYKVKQKRTGPHTATTLKKEVVSIGETSWFDWKHSQSRSNGA